MEEAGDAHGGVKAKQEEAARVKKAEKETEAAKQAAVEKAVREEQDKVNEDKAKTDNMLKKIQDDYAKLQRETEIAKAAQEARTAAEAVALAAAKEKRRKYKEELAEMKREKDAAQKLISEAATEQISKLKSMTEELQRQQLFILSWHHRAASPSPVLNVDTAVSQLCHC